MQKDNSQVKTGREERFWMRDVDLTPLTSAQLDYYAIFKDHALILDWKTGFKRPTASEISWQSRTQAVTLWCTFPEIKHVRAGFASSRLSSYLDVTDYTSADLVRAYNQIKQILWEVKQPDARRVPGQWCRYCAARGSVNCPESIVAATVHTDGVALVPGRGGVMKADELQLALKVARMTPEKIGRAYRLKSIVEAVFGAMAARLRSMPEDQLAEAGYALGPGRPVRSVNDGALAFKRSLEVLTEEERLQCVDFSYTKAAELLAARTKISAEEAKTRVLAALGDSVTETESAKRLKPTTKQ